MLVKPLRRYGALPLTLLLGLTCMLVSAGMTAILDILIKGQVVAADLLIGVIIPAFLAPAIIYLLLRLVARLDGAETMLREVSQRDPLTGLHNRRYLFERAQIEFERARRYGSNLSTLMLDIDHFKTVNDSYGHKAGDEVLRAVATACNEVLRRADMVARYGGEEFAFILPETALSDAIAFAERLRSRLELLEFSLGGQKLRLTASIGVSEVEAQDASIEVAMVRADQALYAAKQSGRNRVWAMQAV